MVFNRGFELQARLTLLATDFKKGLQEANSGLSKFEKGLRDHRKELAVVGGALAGVGLASVKFASDLEESVNKANVTFGDAASVVQQFAQTSADSFGISQRAANEYSGTLGVILQASGLAQDASARMSVELVKLAADLASFNNIPIDVALEKIRAGLVGEIEPLRTVGVLLNAAAVEQKALDLGLVESGGVLTEAAKVQARYALILEQTTIQQGDFTRTADSLTNSLRRSQAQMEDAAATIGQQLIPVAAKVVSIFAGGVSAFNETSTEFKSMTIAAGGVAVALTGIGLILPPLITGIRTLTLTAGFLAANPFVALAAIAGTAFITGTVAGNMRQVANESERASRRLNDFTTAVNDALAAAGKAGISLSREQAALQELEQAFTEVSTAQEIATLREEAANATRIISSQSLQRQRELTMELKEAETDRNAVVQLAVNFVSEFNLTMAEATELAQKFNLSTEETDDVLRQLRIDAAEANTEIRGVGKSASIASGSIDDMSASVETLDGHIQDVRESLANQWTFTTDALTDQRQNWQFLAQGVDEAEALMRQDAQLTHQERVRLWLLQKKQAVEVAAEAARANAEAEEQRRAELKKSQDLVREFFREMKQLEEEASAKLKEEAEERSRTRLAEFAAAHAIISSLPEIFGAGVAAPDVIADVRESLQGSSEASVRADAERVADNRGLTGAEREAFIQARIDAWRRLVGLTGGSADPGFPALAKGGIVTRPTMALIGEAGPEAVLPLSSMGTGPVNVTVNVYGDIHRDELGRVADLVTEAIEIGRITIRE